MANTTKRMMSLELEFIDYSAHGFVSWLDFDGNTVASLGLGETGTDDQGTPLPDSRKYLEWSLEGVDFIKVTGGGIQFDEQRSLEILSNRDIYDEFDEFIRNEDYISSQIHLNNPDSATYEKANVIHEEDSDRFLELQSIKSNYSENINAMILEHENAIAFTNPVTNRIIGMVDTINEAFVWYGAFSLGSVTDDSYFEINRSDETKKNITINADEGFIPEIGFKYQNNIIWSINVTTNNLHIKNENGYGIEVLNDEDAVRFTGEIYYQDSKLLDYFYTQTQLDEGVLDVRYYEKTLVDNEFNVVRQEIEDVKDLINEINNEIEKLKKLSGYKTYYRWNNNEWQEFEPNVIDEEYDLPNEAEENDIWFAELEQTYHIYQTSFSQIQVEEKLYSDALPKVFLPGDLIIKNDVFGGDTFYEWDGNDWNERLDISSINEIYTTVQHKSDIDVENVSDGDIFKIQSTGKFYKYINNNLLEINDPCPLYNQLPDQYDTTKIIILS